MRTIRTAILCTLALSLAGARALDYPNNKELGARLHRLAKAKPDLLRVETLATSDGKLEVWLAECGLGTLVERTNRPALLALAGLDGNDLAGSALLLDWLAQLTSSYATNSSVKELLESTTIYVIPRLNPEAAESFFAKPRLETSVNWRPVDDDHDGLTDEDGPEDLDGDGQITSMRVSDPAGDYIIDPEEPRLLLKADRAKGEAGAWRLLSEGIDNDHDEAWNEDGRGGVNLNRNFPFGFRFFAPDSGVHPVSEPATRKLADFMVAHPHIGIVFAFGMVDNLVQTPKGEAPKRPPTAMHEQDVPFYRELGKEWRQTLGLSKELTGNSEPGTFVDWVYYDHGRLALAARPWSPSIQLEMAKETPAKPDDQPKDAKTDQPQDAPEKKDRPKTEKAETEKAGGKKADADTRNQEDRAFLKWADKNAPELFVPWKPFGHPDFKGGKVEIGGFAPFAKSNPPERMLADLAAKEGSFLTRLASRLPRIAFRKVEMKSLGSSLFDVTVQIENRGYLPTVLAQGVLCHEVNPTRVVLDLEPVSILSGTKRTLLAPIEGSGGMKEVRYVLDAAGRSGVNIEVISMLGGSVRTNLIFKEAK